MEPDNPRNILKARKKQKLRAALEDVSKQHSESSNKAADGEKPKRRHVLSLLKSDQLFEKAQMKENSPGPAPSKVSNRRPPPTTPCDSETSQDDLSLQNQSRSNPLRPRQLGQSPSQPQQNPMSTLSLSEFLFSSPPDSSGTEGLLHSSS